MFNACEKCFKDHAHHQLRTVHVRLKELPPLKCELCGATGDKVHEYLRDPRGVPSLRAEKKE
jgi:hypothetical protein